MSFKDLRVRLIGDASSLTNSLNVSEKKLKAFGDRAKKIGQNLSLKVTAPLVLAGGAAIKFASDFQESLNKVDVSFGKSSESVKAFAKTTLKQFGIAEGSALDMAALFGDMATSMGISQNAAAGMSKQLVGLAGDLASFKNIDIEQATTALAGVFTGETESLKRLGIVMTEVNLKQFAMEKGLDGNIKKMSQSQKVALRYQYILEKTKNSQGDFARTSDGAANQMRIFQESMKQLAASFGQVILPAFTKVVKKLNGFIQIIDSLSPAAKEVIVVISGIAAAIGPILLALPTLISSFRTLNSVLKANPFIAVASGLLAIGTALYRIGAAKKAAKLKEFTDELSDMTEDEALAKYKQLNAEMEENARIIKEGFGSEVRIAKEANKKLQEKKDLLDAHINTMRTAAEDQRLLNEQLKTENSELETNVKLRGEISSVKAEDFGLPKRKKPIQTPMGYATVGDPATSLANSVKNGNGILLTNLNDTGDIIHRKAKDFELEAVEFNNNLGPIFEGGLQNLAVGIGEALGNAIATGGNLGQQLGAVLLGTLGGVATQIGQMAIGIGFALEGIKKALESLNPVVAIAAGIALVALGSFFKSKSQSISKSMGKGGKGGGRGPTPFAKGGIVSSPTLGLIGEYAGASRNPEVVAPLDKLQSMIGDRNGKAVNVTGDFKLRGQDLLVAIDRAEKYRDRIQ